MDGKLAFPEPHDAAKRRFGAHRADLLESGLSWRGYRRVGAGSKASIQRPTGSLLGLRTGEAASVQLVSAGLWGTSGTVRMYLYRAHSRNSLQERK